MDVVQFQQTIWQYYREHGRHDLPWRQPEADGSFDPYKILVSEIMLQQTQVQRVMPKYVAFLEAFPNVEVLAAAPLNVVLQLWSGLGYNRRAKFLMRAAQTVVHNFDGIFPQDQKQLVTLPGVGIHTAGAIMAYAYNAPAVFIETNIRTVYIHHFFADQTDIADAAIATIVGETLDRDNAREWYWALMDYGSFLKQSVGNVSRSSKAYVKQSTFAGSNRQLRGAVIRELLDKPKSLEELSQLLPDDRLSTVLATLVQEGMVSEAQGHFSIT
jgi:A/G-specific adenine glycosylase